MRTSPLMRPKSHTSASVEHKAEDARQINLTMIDIFCHQQAQRATLNAELAALAEEQQVSYQSDNNYRDVDHDKVMESESVLSKIQVWIQ
jgi:hypothetical protein